MRKGRGADPAQSAQRAPSHPNLFSLWIPKDEEHLLIPAAASSSGRRPVTAPSLDLASSGVMRKGGQALCVVFLLSMTLQPAARKLRSKDILVNVNNLIQHVTDKVGALASLSSWCAPRTAFSSILLR